MSKTEILEWFSVNSAALESNRILFVLAIGILVGAAIFITYKLTYKGVAYNPRFNLENVVLLLISATIMLMISGNIVISLGMVGALSIVRFRTAIKDPHDTMYIFWSIIEGLCVGAQIYKLAIISTIVVAIVLIAGSFYESGIRKYLIVIRGNGNLNQEVIFNIAAKEYKKSRIRSFNTEETHSELVIEVTSKNGISENTISNLKAAESVLGVRWMLESSDNVG